MASYRYRVVDTETGLIGPGCEVPELVCVSTFDPLTGLAELFHARFDHAAERFMDWLREPDLILILHRFQFDLAVLCRAIPDAIDLVFRALDEGRLSCTHTREKLLAILDGTLQDDQGPKLKGLKFSMEALAARHLGMDLSAAKGTNGWRMRYGELINTPCSQWPKAAREYPLDDARIPAKLWRHQWDRAKAWGYLAPNGLLVNEQLQLQSAWARKLGTIWGVRADQDAVTKRIGETRRELDRLTMQLLEARLLRPTGKANLAVVRQRVVEAYGRLGLDAPRVVDEDSDEQGQVSYDLETCRGSQDPLLLAFSEYTHQLKNLGTYLEPMREAAGRPLQADYDTLIASGRTSCFSNKLNPSLPFQQLPQKDGIRPCIVPSPGHTFVSADYSLAELRSLAEVCAFLGFKGRHLERALNAGQDPHLRLAARMLKRPFEEVTAAYHGPEKSAIKVVRNRAKPANFGFPGGLGAKGFVSYCARQRPPFFLTLSESQVIRDAYFSEWTEVADFLAWVSSGELPGGLYTVVHPYSGRKATGLWYNAACNRYYQGLTGDGAKDADYQLARAAYCNRSSPLWGCRFPLFIHDELIAEVPAERLHEAGHAVADLMVQVMEKWTPHVKQVVHPAAMDRWYKDAEPSYLARDGSRHVGEIARATIEAEGLRLTSWVKQ